jgi:hypothetical protein
MRAFSLSVLVPLEKCHYIWPIGPKFASSQAHFFGEMVIIGSPVKSFSTGAFLLDFIFLKIYICEHAFKKSNSF